MGKLKALPPRLASLQSRLTHIESGERGRAQASPWRAWYNTKRWRQLRWAVLVRDGFTCQWLTCGRVEPNSALLVADHKRPHRGDERLFWDETNLQTLCKHCHDSRKQRAEAGGRG
ncbi:HNH endonuclease signature motif containing protein [Sphingomonas sp. GC_Shp_3]|uniref:HNH endonuclease n=1 Tax=Sphingomonas sp. GC_Shp_3 TaxID=2937383 RepID=UPI00226AA140